MFNCLNGQFLLEYADSVYNRLNEVGFEKSSIKSYSIIEHKLGILGHLKKDSIKRTVSTLSLDQRCLMVHTALEHQKDTLVLNSSNKKIYHVRQEFIRRDKHSFDTFYSRVYCRYDSLQRLMAASYTQYKKTQDDGKSGMVLLDSFLRIWYNNDMGKTDRSEDHYANRSHISSICKYNEMGKISSIEYFNGDKDHYQFESIKRFIYNKDSALIELIDSNSERTIQTAYSYKGGKIMMSKLTILERTRSCYIPVPVRKFEHMIEYDSIGHVIFVYDSRLKVVFNIDNHYDGNRLVWRHIKSKNKRIKEVYHYDAEGRLIGVNQYRRGIKKSEIDYIYDSKGRLCKLKRYKNGILRECISIVFDKL